ncbi:MAG: ABC transporter ATP-binding protein [Spirochaetaceae bacterium]|nr:MAG: ABC transporter ATP-binding protein [Spirochaetaceae bacterium]
MISAQVVHKTYIDGETQVHALRGIDLNIGEAEFLAIAGPSGSGKSTLLNIIGCIDTPDSGEVQIDGELVTGRKTRDLVEIRRAKIGFVFQNFNLIPVLTAYENVAMSLALLGLREAEIRERSMTMLAEVGLQGMEDRRPSRLSGGQQQRVAVARALVKEPLIVLADEPTANLDSETGEDVLKLMLELNSRLGTTFVFSTHDQMVMEYARRLCLLHDGLIVSDEHRSA